MNISQICLNEQGSANGGTDVLTHSNSNSNTTMDKGRRGRSSKLTVLDTVLLLMLVLALIAVVALAIVVVKDSDRKSGCDETDEKVAGQAPSITPELVAVAASIHSKIDYSVAPCDDFYEFACGSWRKSKIIPEDKMSISGFSALGDQVEIIIKNLLEEPIQVSESDVIKKAKHLYASCINYDLINTRGDKPLKDLLVNTFKGWPIASTNWDETSFDLEETLSQLNQVEHYPLVSFRPMVDDRNSSQRVLTMDQPSPRLGRKNYLLPRNDSIIMAYERLIFSVGQLLGFASPQTAEQEVKDLVDFEIELAKISVPMEQRRDMSKMYFPSTLQHVHDMYGKVFDWKRYVHRVTSVLGVDLINVTDDEIIINRSPTYFENLTTLLQNTPKRTIANHMIWDVVFSLVGLLGDPYREALKAYNKVLYGSSTDTPRHQICTLDVVNTMGLAAGKLFITGHFDRDSKTTILEMVHDLQMAFNQLLDELDWMDEQTKKMAREKNAAITPRIGYPQQLTNDTYLEEIYANFAYHPDQYFENELSTHRESFKKGMRRLREPVDKDVWRHISPAVVNAFYSPPSNEIVFPAGILQPPFFSRKFPKSVNFGGIGTVIGHEITHAFDDQGRQFDKEGNVRQWWSQKAIDKFTVKAQCIIDQYSNYTDKDTGMKLNGLITQGENIADIGGVKESYRAFRNWVQKQGKEEDPLPGLKFNHDQLFFINYAQLSCYLKRKKSKVQQIRSDPHSLGEYRVLGSLQNLPEFSKVFNCPATSYMNRKVKCQVW